MPLNIIGTMSGSSLDGLDIALCEFDASDAEFSWSFRKYETLSIPADLRARLAAAHTLSGFDLMQLHADFGIFTGETIDQFCKKHQITAEYISAHGHTVFHEPALRFTTQIGSGAHIAQATGITTITDFRSADVAAHGQGAPFAPVADTILFPGYTAYLNLGGIANIHIIDEQTQNQARDIGPCNQALNFLANTLGKAYDTEGRLAASGSIDLNITNQLVSAFPYEKGKPLGLSNEKVRSTWITYLKSLSIKTEDLLASTVEAIAILITDHISKLRTQKSKILVTGGGAYNQYLMQRLRSLNQAHEIQFIIPSEEVIEFKECALMAYLGFLTINEKPFSLKHITGADTDAIGGAIYKAIK